MQVSSGLGNFAVFSLLRSVGQETVSISCTLPTPSRYRQWMKFGAEEIKSLADSH